MLYKIDTEVGAIKIRKAVISKIVLESIKKFKGRVFITNHKGKMIRLKSAADYIDVNLAKTGLDIRIYIAIRFGTSISMVTENLIEDIKYNIEKITSLEANSIAIVVTGMISKHMTRRNIEIRG
ncbi:MAG: Asp23/Gls24 family envelope stress response protein [Clostridiales bacterium]|jgi:uncharacterized alkaline shock family protein YloU|nr:Asp23/Gls24 family envelope stress response protein [Clostridiales bacterium]